MRGPKYLGKSSLLKVIDVTSPLLNKISFTAFLHKRPIIRSKPRTPASLVYVLIKPSKASSVIITSPFATLFFQILLELNDA